jgi:phosphoglycolate phosphatase
MPREIRLLALDLDGTLIDSAPDLSHCLGRAVEAAGFLPPSEAETRSWIGDGIEALLRRGLEAASGNATGTTDPAAGDSAPRSRGDSAPHSEIAHGTAPVTLAKALETFDACYWANLYTRSCLYPDVAATLDALLERGVRLCCVTNKRYAFAARLIELSGLAPRLEFTLGGDSCADKKPSPAQLIEAAKRTGVAAEESVLVGDSVHDEHAARAAGFGFVWASYGYGSPAAPDSTLRIARFSELPQALRNF